MNKIKRVLPFVSLICLCVALISLSNSRKANKVLKSEIEMLKVGNDAIKASSNEIGSEVHEITDHLEAERLDKERTRKQEAAAIKAAKLAEEAKERAEHINKFKNQDSPAIEAFVEKVKKESTPGEKKKIIDLEAKSYAILPASYNIDSLQVDVKQTELAKKEKEKAAHLKKWTAHKKQ